MILKCEVTFVGPFCTLLFVLDVYYAQLSQSKVPAFTQGLVALLIVKLGMTQCEKFLSGTWVWVCSSQLDVTSTFHIISGHVPPVTE